LFWGTMAYTSIGGTIVGTVLTLLFLLALYSIWFRVEPGKKTFVEEEGFTGLEPLSAKGNTIELWIRETEWVVGGSKGAAVRLGLNRTTLIFRMRKLGISRPSTVGTGRSSLPNVATDGNFHA